MASTTLSTSKVRRWSLPIFDWQRWIGVIPFFLFALLFLILPSIRILTGSFDYTARLWEVDYRDFVAAVCARLLRDFTEEEREQAHITDQEPTCPQVGK